MKQHPLIQSMLSFFPHYTAKSVQTMYVNIMSNWHVMPSDSLDFKTLTYYNDSVVAEVKKHNEEVEKQRAAAKNRR